MMSPEDSWVAKWQRIGKDLLKHTVMVLKKRRRKYIQFSGFMYQDMIKNVKLFIIYLRQKGDTVSGKNEVHLTLLL